MRQEGQIKTKCKPDQYREAAQVAVGPDYCQTLASVLKELCAQILHLVQGKLYLLIDSKKTVLKILQTLQQISQTMMSLSSVSIVSLYYFVNACFPIAQTVKRFTQVNSIIQTSCIITLFAA